MDRILQIMPAPTGMRAKYKVEDDTEIMPVICLALVEEDGDTFVKPMVAWDDGDTMAADSASNFVGYLYQNE